MQILNLLLTVLCISIPIGVVVVAAILGTRSRLRYAARIRDAQARGVFADMNTPENKARFRILAIFALVGLLGMFLSMAILVMQLRSRFAGLYEVTIAVAILFGIVAAIAGSLMQREINRRL
jgi:hypothetical protein